MAGTVVGAGLSIEGELTSEDEIVVHGAVRGSLTSSGPVGTVEADVSGSSLSIAGKVTGNVTTTDRIDIQAGGRLIGDVKSARLTIADGASFKGNVDMDV
jgi:cytoskeletal protein CcmA (bactofilin family)